MRSKSTAPNRPNPRLATNPSMMTRGACCAPGAAARRRGPGCARRARCSPPRGVPLQSALQRRVKVLGEGQAAAQPCFLDGARRMARRSASPCQGRRESSASASRQLARKPSRQHRIVPVSCRDSASNRCTGGTGPIRYRSVRRSACFEFNSFPAPPPDPRCAARPTTASASADSPNRPSDAAPAPASLCRDGAWSRSTGVEEVSEHRVAPVSPAPQPNTAPRGAGTRRDPVSETLQQPVRPGPGASRQRDAERVLASDGAFGCRPRRGGGRSVQRTGSGGGAEGVELGSKRTCARSYAIRTRPPVSVAGRDRDTETGRSRSGASFRASWPAGRCRALAAP